MPYRCCPSNQRKRGGREGENALVCLLRKEKEIAQSREKRGRKKEDLDFPFPPNLFYHFFSLSSYV